jgi:hypothetical protein
MDHLYSPDCVPILAVNPMDQTASLPPYIVAAISMADYMVESKSPLPIEAQPPSLKILDFGNGALLGYGISCVLTWYFQHISREKSGHRRSPQSEYALLRLSFP